ncbi:MAG TPA: apolipoprotein N-acyltransferase [Acidimicrobiia bacterium]|nr:apolipoprotein N-acyltransferase [Acidimicrobiia bacterium]
MQLAAAALISAALMWLSFPPVNLGFLVFVAPVPLLWALRRARTRREAVWVGLIYGFAFFGGMLWWIFLLGAVAWVPLVSTMVVYVVAYALLMFVVRLWSPMLWWTVAVGGWAAFEFLRSHGPLGGFPWGAAGFPIGTIPGARGAAQWIGPTGWGVLVIAFAAAVVLLAEEEPDRRPLEVITALIVVLAAIGLVLAPDAGGTAMRVAIVQGNSPCPRQHCDGEKQLIYESHLALTRSITAGSVDLVVWAEDSFGGSFNPTFNPEVTAQMGSEAVRLGAYLLAGGSRSAGTENWDNYNVLFAPDGSIVGEYLKRHPVPFGEFVPMRNLLGFIPQLDQVPRDLRRGEGPVVFPLAIGDESLVLGSVISFEGAFPRYLRSEVQAGAQVAVVATNEGSYGSGPASDQLIGMVRLNAAALGVDVVHAAVTGRSTFIRADGSLDSAATGLFTGEVLYGSVSTQESRRTLYTVTGDWLELAAIAVAGMALVVGWRHPRDFRIKPLARR